MIRLFNRIVKRTRKKFYPDYEPGYLISWISCLRQTPPQDEKVILWTGRDRFLGYWTGEEYLGLTPTGWVPIEAKAWFLMPPYWDELEEQIERIPFRKLRWRYIFFTRLAILVLIIVALVIFLCIYAINYLLG